MNYFMLVLIFYGNSVFRNILGKILENELIYNPGFYNTQKDCTKKMNQVITNTKIEKSLF